MAWSGGTFTRAGGSTNWADDRDAAVEIEAGLHDTHDQDLADGINACMAKDGSNAATGNLNLGTNRITNVGDPTAAQDAATKAYVDEWRVPTGAVMAFAQSTTPSFWLECDGTSIGAVGSGADHESADYADLFGIVKTAYGNAGTEVFASLDTVNLPDLRGEFVRGWDHSRGVDSGRGIGTTQADEFEAHTHTESEMYQPGGSVTGVASASATGAWRNRTVNTSSAGGSETRPRNVALMYCIKI